MRSPTNGPGPELGLHRHPRRPGWRRAAAALGLGLLAGGCERSGDSSPRQSAQAQVIPSPRPRSEHESFRRLEQDEVTPSLEARAQEILEMHYDAPYGAHVDFNLDGKTFRAVLERHYHPPGEDGPDGHHKGVTLYVAR